MSKAKKRLKRRSTGKVVSQAQWDEYHRKASAAENEANRSRIAADLKEDRHKSINRAWYRPSIELLGKVPRGVNAEAGKLIGYRKRKPS